MAKLLIVEDNEHMHRIYADKFRREGYQVLDAFDGEQGIAFAEREKPTVILLDLMMPKMDGYQVLDRLKNNPATAGIPVLVISNKCQPADIERALVLGARNFFHKGMTLLDDLAMETRKLCNLRKALIVSSRPAVVDGLSKQLTALDYLSSCNSLVVEILPRVERERPDVLFLDGQLTGLNFNLLVHRLQSSLKAKSVPLILVDHGAAGVLPNCAQLVGQLGMPIDPIQLAELLKRCAPAEAAPAAA